ncbi:MAG: hypothetical protein PHT55_01365, partial [Spirochaetales bacterium]|nr:hypothetical protein [Spirochaetales bacterium]
MSHTRSFSRTRALGCFKLIVALFLIAAAIPAFGQIKSVRSRVLEKPSDIITTRKANFRPGDILDTPLVSITVKNDAVAAVLLMKLNIDFGGEWDSDYVTMGFVKKMAANESFTFTNSDMLDYLDMVRSDIQYSESLLTHTGISSLDQIANIGSLKMPEGTYKIELSAYEVTNAIANPDDKDSTIDESKWTHLDTISVDFNVVTIEAIANITLPTYNNQALTFQVPEIPVYNDARGTSTSSTEVTITGPGVNYKGTKDHAASVIGSSAIKGYPGDTTDGYVSYDLGAVNFRAGETYSIGINFIDWNESPITDKTVSVTFPTPKLTHSIDTSEPFQPVFSWGFSGTDYNAGWVKEYRVYLNGSYLGYTADTSFQAPSLLSPGTNYTWYVMPINRDGSNFFASTSGLVQSFTTAAHTELAVSIDAPANNAVLLKGETYGFSGSAEYSQGATEKQASWNIGNKVENGLAASYTPTARYTNNSLRATLSVTDSLNLTKTATVNLTVLDPAIAVQGDASRTVNKGATATFAVDTQNTRDIQTYEWFVNGSSVGGGAQRSYTFADAGSYEVYVTGTSAQDMNGIARTVESAKVTFVVAGAGPTVAISQPAAGGSLPVGRPLNFLTSISNDNPIKNIVWTVNASVAAQGAGADSFTFTPQAAGENTITVTVTDSFDKTASASLRILAIDPQVSVTSPQANNLFALSASLTPTFSAPNATRIEWFIDAQQIPSTSVNLEDVGVGSHQLYAVAYWNSMDSTGTAVEYSEESARVAFTVRDLSPPVVAINFPTPGMTLKTGENYSFEASADSGSAIVSTQWEVNGQRLADNRYSPVKGSTSKSLNISYTATNAEGIQAKATVTVRLIDPAVYLTIPASNEFPLGVKLPVSGTAVDASLNWIIDGLDVPAWGGMIDEPGPHSLRAGWSAEAVDGSGMSQIFTGESEAFEFTVYSTAAPVVTSFSPSATALKEAAGVPLTFSVSATSENNLQPVSWSALSGSVSVGQGAGDSFTQDFANPGNYIVRAVVSDSRGQSASKEWTVRVIAPSIAITSPAEGSAFGLNGMTMPTVAAQDLNSYSFVLDGNPVPQDFAWASVSLGSHSLSAVGQYAVTSQAQTQTVTSNTVNFTVENRTPPAIAIEGARDGDRIIAGQAYSFIASNANSDQTVEYQWLKNGSPATPSFGPGGEYRFTPAAPDGELTLTVRARLVQGAGGQGSGIMAEKSVKVRVIDPFINQVLPTSLAFNGQYPAQTPIPLKAEQRNIDRVEWRVDGQPFSGTAVSLESGNHSIEVRGFASGVRLPDASYGEYEAVGTGISERDINVAQRVFITRINAPQAIYSNEAYNVSVDTAGDTGGDLIASISYNVDGKLFKQEKSPVTKAMVVSGLTQGRHAVSVVLADVFGSKTTQETSVTVHSPLAISIRQPAD